MLWGLSFASTHHHPSSTPRTPSNLMPTASSLSCLGVREKREREGGRGGDDGQVGQLKRCFSVEILRSKVTVLMEACPPPRTLSCPHPGSYTLLLLIVDTHNLDPTSPFYPKIMPFLFPSRQLALLQSTVKLLCTPHFLSLPLALATPTCPHQIPKHLFFFFPFIYLFFLCILIWPFYVVQTHIYIQPSLHTPFGTQALESVTSLISFSPVFLRFKCRKT